MVLSCPHCKVKLDNLEAICPNCQRETGNAWAVPKECDTDWLQLKADDFLEVNGYAPDGRTLEEARQEEEDWEDEL